MTEHRAFTRSVCVDCGAVALVAVGEVPEPYRCERCRGTTSEAVALGDDVRVSRFWRDNRGNAGVGGAFAALDEVFNPAAARAHEQVKGDHERQVPNPSPGDDALRTGSLVIRVEKPRATPDK